MSDNAASISKRSHDIATAKRRAIAEATKGLRAMFAEQERELRQDCLRITKHKWVFEHIGIFAHLHWHRCAYCGAKKVVDVDKEDA
jgi:hypothetical protein